MFWKLSSKIISTHQKIRNPNQKVRSWYYSSYELDSKQHEQKCKGRMDKNI